MAKQKKTNNKTQTKDCSSDTVTFIIMGGGGDLSIRKLIPAIYNLLEKKTITNCSVVLTARSPRKAAQVLTKAKKYIKKVKVSTWNKLVSCAIYHQMDFSNPGDYQKLDKLNQKQETKLKLCGNRIFYLATIPQNFNIITKNLARTKTIRNTKTHSSKVVYEKPFGDNYKSAKSINKSLKKHFTEKQVYRVDHYLEKELVSNIGLLRFTNRILEPLFSHKHIESIQIIINEKLDVQKRGRFYDNYGALKDVVQNHALQLLALTCMGAPKRLDGEHIRASKAKFLKSLMIKDFFLGQYEGYKNTKGVTKNSKTETFAAVKLISKERRWENVPFFIKTGKALKEKRTLIQIKFKPVKCLLDYCPSETNHLTINIDPVDNIHFHLNSKVPNSHQKVAPVKLNFSQKANFNINTPKAYQILLEDVIKGDQSVFVRSDEIEFAWKVIDKIEDLRKKPNKKYPHQNKLYTYKKGASSPEELGAWNKKHKIKWTA